MRRLTVSFFLVAVVLSWLPATASTLNPIENLKEIQKNKEREDRRQAEYERRTKPKPAPAPKPERKVKPGPSRSPGSDVSGGGGK